MFEIRIKASTFENLTMSHGFKDMLSRHHSGDIRVLNADEVFQALCSVSNSGFLQGIDIDLSLNAEPH